MYAFKCCTQSIKYLALKILIIFLCYRSHVSLANCRIFPKLCAQLNNSTSAGRAFCLQNRPIEPLCRTKSQWSVHSLHQLIKSAVVPRHFVPEGILVLVFFSLKFCDKVFHSLLNNIIWGLNRCFRNHFARIVQLIYRSSCEWKMKDMSFKCFILTEKNKVQVNISQ